MTAQSARLKQSKKQGPRGSRSGRKNICRSQGKISEELHSVQLELAKEGRLALFLIYNPLLTIPGRLLAKAARYAFRAAIPIVVTRTRFFQRKLRKCFLSRNLLKCARLLSDESVIILFSRLGRD